MQWIMIMIMVGSAPQGASSPGKTMDRGRVWRHRGSAFRAPAYVNAPWTPRDPHASGSKLSTCCLLLLPAHPQLRLFLHPRPPLLSTGPFPSTQRFPPLTTSPRRVLHPVLAVRYRCESRLHLSEDLHAPLSDGVAIAHCACAPPSTSCHSPRRPSCLAGDPLPRPTTRCS